MTIEQQTQTILSLLTAQTQAIAGLATAISAIPTAPGTTPSDNTEVLAAIATLQASTDKIAAGTTDIQAQLETPAEPVAPSPAPDATPALDVTPAA